MTIRLLQLNRLVEESLELSLKEIGYDVQFSLVTSRQEISRRLQCEQFDVLVLDLADDDLLKNCRAIERAANIPTVILSPRDGPTGFIRAPLLPDEANVYIDSLSFLVFDTVFDTVNKLLAGASTQARPGDEGYLRRENADLAAAFDYPAFWKVPGGSSYKRAPYQCVDDRAVGPKNRRNGLFSAVEVSVYRRLRPVQLNVKEILNFEFAHYQDVRQVVPAQTIEVDGWRGNRSEYTWTARYWNDQPGRSIIATVVKEKQVYVLHLRAADDLFDDFRPVYDQLLKTFQFLAS